MAIDSLFTKEEQIDILWKVKEVKQEYERQGTSKNRKFYFTKFADKYDLIGRLDQQVEDYKRGIISQEELTTNSEIACLFGVRINSVDSYLARRALNKKRQRGARYV